MEIKTVDQPALVAATVSKSLAAKVIPQKTLIATDTKKPLVAPVEKLLVATSPIVQATEGQAPAIPIASELNLLANPTGCGLYEYKEAQGISESVYNHLYSINLDNSGLNSFANYHVDTNYIDNLALSELLVSRLFVKCLDNSSFSETYIADIDSVNNDVSELKDKAFYHVAVTPLTDSATSSEYLYSNVKRYNVDNTLFVETIASSINSLQIDFTSINEQLFNRLNVTLIDKVRLAEQIEPDATNIKIKDTDYVMSDFVDYDYVKQTPSSYGRDDGFNLVEDLKSSLQVTVQDQIRLIGDVSLNEEIQALLNNYVLDDYVDLNYAGQVVGNYD